MSTAESVKNQIKKLIAMANDVTKKSDTNLTSAVLSLIKQCGGDVPDIPDVPDEPTVENLIVYPYMESFSPGTVSGITVTDNGDGSFTLNGELNGERDFHCLFNLAEPLVEGETYVLSLGNEYCDSNAITIENKIGSNYNDIQLGVPYVCDYEVADGQMLVIFVPPMTFDNVIIRPTLYKV